MSIHTLEEILHPQSIAVVGASNNPNVRGHDFTLALLAQGFQGKIYPVNPRYSEILGLKAYPSLREIPWPVDYVISCVPASQVLDMLEDCSQNGVKAVHLYTARFSETGRPEDAKLEQEMLKKAKECGVRLIGPNCLGLYDPRQGIAFPADMPKEPGSVGLISQTGGGSTGFIHAAAPRGVRFSKVISYGNALDFNECDFLDYFAHDPETKVILLYIEGTRDGRRFLNSLRQAASIKPVIVLKGGRGKAGARATTSHTASLAGSMKAWEAAVAQADAVLAESFDEVTDLAVSFSFLPPIYGRRVGAIGGGGGPSVSAADQCEEGGLEVIPMPLEIREELRKMGAPTWAWVGNPFDQAMLADFSLPDTTMLQMMVKNQNFDLLIANVTEGIPTRKEMIIPRLRADIRAYIKIKEENLKPLLVVVGERSLSTENHNHWRWLELSNVRAELLAAGIPFYPSLGRAARAANKLIGYYQRRAPA